MNRLPFKIIFEDRNVIVIGKPVGLLSTHTRVTGRAAREAQATAENWLNDYVRKGQRKSSRRVWLVHRLDRETSGVMLFAKSEAVAEYFRADWNRLTEKTYVALAGGVMAAEGGVFESYLAEDADGFRVHSVADPAHGRLARTEWKKLAVRTVDGGMATLVEVSLKSGRKNQIRVHFAEAGHPLVGDVKYGGIRAARLYLHSLRLRFRHPATGEWKEFEDECGFL